MEIAALVGHAFFQPCQAQSPWLTTFSPLYPTAQASGFYGAYHKGFGSKYNVHLCAMEEIGKQANIITLHMPSLPRMKQG
jgi:hypothetical protein